MADLYSKWVMTNAFANNSQAALNTGNKIEWVALKTSDDTHTSNDLPGFNDTTLATAKIKQTSSINSVVINGNTVTITGLFNSIGNTADYYIKTIFLVAKYNGTEFLAGSTVANTPDSAFRMPAESTTEITEFTSRPQISVTNSSTISSTVDPVAAATNERVNNLESSVNSKIKNINEDKQNLWNKLSNYVTKTLAETIDGTKTFTDTIVGSITGNAGTASKLKNNPKINGVAFDGTEDIDIVNEKDVSREVNEALSMTGLIGTNFSVSAVENISGGYIDVAISFNGVSLKNPQTVLTTTMQIDTTKFKALSNCYLSTNLAYRTDSQQSIYQGTFVIGKNSGTFVYRLTNVPQTITSSIFLYDTFRFRLYRLNGG